MMESRDLQPEEEASSEQATVPTQPGIAAGQDGRVLQNVPGDAGRGGDGFPRAENVGGRMNLDRGNMPMPGQRQEAGNGFPERMAAPEAKEDPVAAEGRESYERFYEAVKLISQSSSKPILSIAEFEQLRAASSAQNPTDGYGMFILGAVANMSERLDQGFQVENLEAGGMLYAALSQAEVFFRDLRRQNGQKFIEIAYRMYPDIFRNFGKQLTPADVKFIENTVFGAFRKLRTNLDRLVGEGQEAGGGQEHVAAVTAAPGVKAGEAGGAVNRTQAGENRTENAGASAETQSLAA